MSEHFEVAIIGGGAAGLFAGNILGKKTIILEKGDRPGRKLLLTGGGRCNYTHNASLPELLDHYNGNRSFISHALFSYPPQKIIQFFSSMGIKPEIADNGKVFPLFGDSHSIVSVLEKGVSLRTNTNVISISKDDCFIIETDSGIITSNYVLIATGGNSYPHTGSDGNGYILAKSLGHTITRISPALAPLKLSLNLSKAEGITLPLTIKIGKKEYSGSAVITKQGISGPLAEDISFMFPENKEISIRFSEIDIPTLRKNQGKTLLKNTINLPERLSYTLLGDLSNKKVADLKKDEEIFISKQLSDCKCMAKAIQAGAMSTHGGIDTKEINSKTMESKLVEGLFFAGDIVDVDANCGGYSLTWAFSSAYLAAEAIKNKQK